MLDEDSTDTVTTDSASAPAEGEVRPRARRRSARRPAGPPPETTFSAPVVEKSTPPAAEAVDDSPSDAPARRGRRRRAVSVDFAAPQGESDDGATGGSEESGAVAAVPVFQPPSETPARRRRRREPIDEDGTTDADTDTTADAGDDESASDDKPARRRRGRGRGAKAPDADSTNDNAEQADESDSDAADGPDQSAKDDSDDDGGGVRRRRRRRRGGGGGGGGNSDDSSKDEVTALKGSTRIEAKKQRRKEGRESGRRRAPLISEAEFLARRESVKRTMVVRQRGDLTQIVVLEDGVLVEHYVNQATATSLVGNVYLGRVQNVLPSMEAAFVDIGRGRNAVLYAGEVNWDAAGLEGQPKRIEQALKSGDKVLVQVTKDPIGHKGARLTSQVSLPGRFIVYVPDGSMTGISRKLPDKERTRLRKILRDALPEGAGVIVRTAAEGASEEDLARDVEHLTSAWEQIGTKAEKVSPPSLLHSEPDLALRVVRDIFNSDFETLVVSGDEIGDTLVSYVADNAPGLSERVTRWTEAEDVFAHYRVDEQLAKALDRKVFLPSGGSLVIDRTEAMTVIDVNTGRFTGQGGNLEETVTRNNLEAAEEIVRQIRLRDAGGIIVIDFIDMVLESNRDLVLRRLVECLGRDRTKHQVAEVTSLGLVQMTRKRIGQGLLETFSDPCEVCNGRGVKVHVEPAEHRNGNRKPRSVRPPGAHDPVEAAAARARAAEDDATKDEAAKDEAEPSADESVATDSPDAEAGSVEVAELAESAEVDEPEVSADASTTREPVTGLTEPEPTP